MSLCSTRPENSWGRATAGYYGHALGKSLGLGYVKPEFAAVGTELQIEILGERKRVTVLVDSPYDPGEQGASSVRLALASAAPASVAPRFTRVRWRCGLFSGIRFMSKQSFSALALIRRGLAGHLDWQKQWRKPSPKAAYDAIIVGGGGHGLGAAYYLAKEHGLTNIAVLEKGWIGGGNTGRNTTIIRSNYLFNESAALYDHSVKIWETLSQELNYNVMFSPRGVMMLAHTVHDIQVFKRHVHANRCNGVDNEWLEPQQAKDFCPLLNIGSDIRYPVLGAALQRRGGTARDTMRLPGGSPAPPTRWAWTSSRTAK